MDSTNLAYGIAALTAKAEAYGLQNVGKVVSGESDISFSDALSKTTEVKASANTSENSAMDITKKTTSTNVQSSAKNVKQQTETATSENDKKDLSQKVAEKVTDKASDLKDAIKEEFSKTDEEIEEAMEVLALSVQDLFNPADLRGLMMELTGTTDSIELITNVDLYDSVKSITAFADELISQISEELMVTTDEVAEIMASDDFKDIMSTLLAEGMSDAENTEILSEETTSDIAEVSEVTADANTVGKVPVEKTSDEDVKPVKVTVEVETSPEARTANPITTDATSQKNTSSNSGSDKKQNLFSKDNNQETVVQPQTVTTQTVNSVGDIVETVTSYSTYADTENIMRQVTDFVKVNISEDVTKMEMQLHPASLGTVNMQINSQNGQITAHLTVQNELVKSILESQMVKLQETFNEQGTKVTAIEVSVATSNLDARSDNNYSQSDNNDGRRGSGRRGINLNEIDSFDDLTDEELLQAEVMEMNGASVNYMA